MVTNCKAFFNSVKRCLRPGGRLIFRDVTSDNKLLLWFMDKIELPIANMLGHGDVNVAKSAMDISCTDNITYNGENVLVIVEGLSMYLCKDDIKQIFSIIEKSFMYTGLQALYIIKDFLVMIFEKLYFIKYH